MKFKRHRNLSSLLLMLTLSCTCFAADKKELAAALAAVEANLKTPAGKQYDEQVGKEFPFAAVKQCKQSVPQGTSIDPFDMFVRLNAEGKVQEVLVYPETQFSGCMRTALATAKFINPPHGDYWINIHMQLKR